VQGKCRRAVHAEVNVLTQAGVAAKGATLYVTKRPCLYCASVAVNAGIARVVYITDHHPDVYQLDALELLRSSGIEVVHSPMNITDCLAKEQEDVF
jgi:dCMP deaminase